MQSRSKTEEIFPQPAEEPDRRDSLPLRRRGLFYFFWSLAFIYSFLGPRGFFIFAWLERQGYDWWEGSGGETRPVGCEYFFLVVAYA